MEILILIIILIVIVACIIGGIYATIYNDFQDVVVRINEVEAMLDSNLRNKYDLLNRSIALINAHVTEEKEIFDDIVKLRSRKISNFELDRILIVAYNEFIVFKEEHKEINKSEEIKKISEELILIDKSLESLRNYYNNNITKYNKMTKSFPTNIVASICKYKEKLFYDRKDMTDEDYEDFKL